MSDVINHDWFLLGHPWAQSDYADFAVMAGSNDPHQGVMLFDMHDAMDDDELGGDTRRAIAAHIVHVHNNYIRLLTIATKHCPNDHHDFEEIKRIAGDW